MKESPKLIKFVRQERKELDKIIKREFGTIGKKMFYGKATSADLNKHINFQIKKREEFFKDQFKQRLETLAVRHQRN